MKRLSRRYNQLVGLIQDWLIADVWLHMRDKTLGLPLEFGATMLYSPSVGLRDR